MPYSEVDNAIEAWANKNGLHLFHEWNGKENRFFYHTNALGECYQIVINPPDDGKVKVDVWIIEGNDLVDYHLALSVPSTGLHNVLSNVLKIVKVGMKQ